MAEPLAVVEPTEQGQWEAHLAELARGHDNYQWEIAEAIIAAPKAWGDTYTLAVRVTGKRKATLENWVSVARKFDSSRRREFSDLRFGHFEAVAGLTTEQQNKLLKKAIKD